MHVHRACLNIGRRFPYGLEQVPTCLYAPTPLGECHQEAVLGRRKLDVLAIHRNSMGATVDLPSVVRGQVQLVLANHALLTTQIQALDRHIKATVRRDETARRLQTIPGIGPFGALLLQAEIGPIARFGAAQELAAYAGLVPSTRSSGVKTRHGAVGRGNPWLKWLLIEALQTLKLAPGPVGDHYRKLLRAKGKPGRRSQVQARLV